MVHIDRTHALCQLQNLAVYAERAVELLNRISPDEDSDIVAENLHRHVEKTRELLKGTQYEF